MSSLKLPHGVSIPDAELEVSASRSSGPGGQSVNTSDSKIELRWSIPESNALTETQRARLLNRLASRLTADGVLILTGSEHKSQHRNREAVRTRFQAIVGEALEPPRKRRKTLPTRGSKERRLRAKKQQGEIKRLRRRPET
ncbi:MAG: alternative ribosome rescue aminoacyl-tRNA hydrolase ArfB [Pontimonas sp.]